MDCRYHHLAKLIDQFLSLATVLLDGYRRRSLDYSLQSSVFVWLLLCLPGLDSSNSCMSIATGPAERKSQAKTLSLRFEPREYDWPRTASPTKGCQK